uniref:Uncharacterized protein n=1 Tax=Chenopodium quinoa TaxID=63459 RepID=A0A803MI76_CHEQI
MRPIRLPEPPTSPRGMPEIFEGGVFGVIRRAVIIGNGFPGAENQCVGLVRALGLSDKHLFYGSCASSWLVTCRYVGLLILAAFRLCHGLISASLATVEPPNVN